MKRSFWINFAIVMMAVVCGLYAAEQPWKEMKTMTARRDEKLKAMKESERKSAELMAEAVKDKTSLGAEALARQNNWVRPGQRPVPQP